jgi:two-component sensor histidine kinase/PAS domain-containing protein
VLRGCQVANRKAPGDVEINSDRDCTAQPRILHANRGANVTNSSFSESEGGGADRTHLHVVESNPIFSLGTERRNNFARALLAMVREPMVVLDRQCRIVAASGAYCRLFPAKRPTTPGRPFREFVSLRWDNAVLEDLQSVLLQGQAMRDREVDLDVPGVGTRRMLVSIGPANGMDQSDAAIIVALQDLTASRETEALVVALRDKQAMLLAEVHHRVANSLQIIASILLLKARSVKSEETRLHLHDVHHRLISVATVQRQLSVTVPGNDIELGPYLQALCVGLADSMIGDDRHITIEASASAGAIKSEHAVSFGLIVTELVINSLKHGFPGTGKGHIAVTYAKDGDDWCLAVVDNGVGRVSDPPEGARVGLGTSIVEVLARNLDAQVEIGHPSAGAATAIIHSAQRAIS